tara:strand:- start:2356 stop:2520 length:165 start_codon:yes stop_codon:yes gene_type:complete
MESKKCPKCKEVVPKSGYSRNQYRVSSYCKPCASSYYKEKNKLRKKRKGDSWWV